MSTNQGFGNYARFVGRMCLAAVFCSIFSVDAAMASQNSSRQQSFSSSSAGPSEGHMGRQDMTVDVSMNYVRDLRADGTNDTAARVSLGGMFNHWLGLDIQGLFEIKSQSYLVGTDLKMMPVDWFFLKFGVGGYAQKETNQFRGTPLAGAGIIAPLSREYYVVTETNYFQVEERKNISFGVGLGLVF